MAALIIWYRRHFDWPTQKRTEQPMEATGMSNIQMDKCPACRRPLERGFAVKSVSLSFVQPDKFRKFMFMDEDLQRVGFLAKILPSRARYCPSFLCRSCHLYLVDYGTTLSRGRANDAARRLETQTNQT